MCNDEEKQNNNQGQFQKEQGLSNNAIQKTELPKPNKGEVVTKGG